MADVAGTLVTVTGEAHSLGGQDCGSLQNPESSSQQSQSCAVPEPWPWVTSSGTLTLSPKLYLLLLQGDA